MLGDACATPLVEHWLRGAVPALCFAGTLAIQPLGNIAHMFYGTIPIHDPLPIVEVLLRLIPDPGCAVADHFPIIGFLPTPRLAAARCSGRATWPCAWNREVFSL